MSFVLDFSWILTILVGLLTFYIANKYFKMRKLPPGPIPLPLVGSLLSFRKRNAIDVLKAYKDKYGDIFTVWIGQLPFVFICGLPQIKEAMLERRNDFAGRTSLRSQEIFLDGHFNIGDSDFGKPWETLRKLGHTAIRKYAASEKLPPLVEKVTKELAENMLEENEAFDPKDKIYHAISNIIASSILGKRFSNDDPEFLQFRNIAEIFTENFGNGFMLDFLPLMRYFYKDQEQQLKEASRNGISILFQKLKEHMESYEQGAIRDVIDSVISAREETIAEGKEEAVYMNDMNLSYALFDLYFASIETTQIAIRWMLLLLSLHSDVQEMVINELQDQIGDRMPVQEDRKLCPLTTAVIYETLRFRASAPFALPHKAICDSQIDGYKIPKGMYIIVYVDMVHHSSKNWNEPQKFFPQRFLDADGKFTESRLSQFMPFGQGRRSCIGEKLAIVEMFLILAGIFRKCRIGLKVKPEDMNPKDVFFSTPKPYKITAKRI